MDWGEFLSVFLGIVVCLILSVALWYKEPGWELEERQRKHDQEQGKDAEDEPACTCTCPKHRRTR